MVRKLSAGPPPREELHTPEEPKSREEVRRAHERAREIRRAGGQSRELDLSGLFDRIFGTEDENGAREARYKGE